MSSLEKLTYSVKEAAAVVGIGYIGMYDLCHRDDFPAIRIGKRIVIPKDGLQRWLVRQSGEALVDGQSSIVGREVK